MGKIQMPEPGAENVESAKLVYPEHVAAQLALIAEGLRAPDPFKHAGLYAAQQALCWAAHPEAFAPPYAAIVGKEAG